MQFVGMFHHVGFNQGLALRPLLMNHGSIDLDHRPSPLYHGLCACERVFVQARPCA